jgi:hypothetical protein
MAAPTPTPLSVIVMAAQRGDLHQLSRLLDGLAGTAAVAALLCSY